MGDRTSGPRLPGRTVGYWADPATVTWPTGLLGVAVGLLIVAVTAQVGVRGGPPAASEAQRANVPSPAVTPINLLFNVVAMPGYCCVPTSR